MLVTTRGSYTGPFAANPTISADVPGFSLTNELSVSLTSTPGLLIVRFLGIYLIIYLTKKYLHFDFQYTIIYYTMSKVKRFMKWLNRGKTATVAGLCWRFTNNKVLELQYEYRKEPTEWFRFCVQSTRKTDQPGFCIHGTLLWFNLEFLLYDRRQWDYKNNKFKKIDNVQFKYF